MENTLSSKIDTSGIHYRNHTTSTTFPKYIVVEGPIGVGKTTLVELLAQKLNARTVFEVFEENPFLANFYTDRARYAFQTEMFFLLERYRQQELFSQGDLFQQHAISDYVFQKNKLFAGETLKNDELTLYLRIYSILEKQIPKPDLVLYLYAPLDILLKRIEQRGRPYEKNFDAEYLSNLIAIYHNFFSSYRESPLITIDTTNLNFPASDEDVVNLYNYISEHCSGRHSYP